MLAAAVRGADKSAAFQSRSPEFTAENTGDFWRGVTETLQLLKKQRQPDGHLCWTFENARLHIAVRPDGTSLALFTRPAEPPASEVTRLLVEFQELPA